MVKAFLSQCIWLLKELKAAEVVVCWFADYHGFLPTLFAKALKKPVIVILGGYDAIRLPSLGYGAYLKRWRRLFQGYVLKNANVLLPVSDSLIWSKNSFATWPEESVQGIQALFPGLGTRTETVPTGYVPEDWPLGPDLREPIVSTVAILGDHVTLRRKGIDLLIEAARRLPDVKFRIIGIQPEFLEEMRDIYAPPANVKLIPRTPREELSTLYQQTSVYAQVSRAEGLPNVLCEAMLSGCIPVGSAVFGIPDGVGNAGFIVDRPDPELLASTIDEALRSDPSKRKDARNHIVQSFHRDRRRSALLGILRSLRSQALQNG